MRGTLIMLLSIIPTAFLLSQQSGHDVVLPTSESLKATQAAIQFAKTVAPVGTAEYTAALRKALALANGYAVSEEAARSLKTRPSELGVLDLDPRYRSNVVSTQDDNTRIWGGMPVPAGAYPDTVAITGNGQLCTGSVVAPDAVLTAAHCYCRGITAQVIIGNNINSPTQPPILVDGQKSKAMIKCTQDLRDGDVAVLFLQRAVTITPRAWAPNSLIASAKVARVLGFGLTEKPTVAPLGINRVVDVPMASPSCTGSVTTVNGAVSDSVFYKCTARTELVAGAPSLNKDTCDGDSGGPLLVQSVDGGYYLAATTSRPTGPPGLRPCGDGGIYVRTDGAVKKWVEDLGINIMPGPSQ